MIARGHSGSDFFVTVLSFLGLLSIVGLTNVDGYNHEGGCDHLSQAGAYLWVQLGSCLAST